MTTAMFIRRSRLRASSEAISADYGGTAPVRGGDPYARDMRVTRIGLGPLFPDEGSRRRRTIRRLRGIPLEVLAFVLVTLLLPVLLVLATAVDAVLWLA